MGGMIPYFEGRVGPGWDQLGTRTSDRDYTKLLKELKKRPLDYFKMFYARHGRPSARTIRRSAGLRFFGSGQCPLRVGRTLRSRGWTSSSFARRSR